MSMISGSNSNNRYLRPSSRISSEWFPKIVSWKKCWQIKRVTCSLSRRGNLLHRGGDEGKFRAQPLQGHPGSRRTQQISGLHVQTSINSISQHNNANICVFGVDCLGIKLCSELAMTYLTSAFDQEERNILRLGIMADY